MFDNYVLPTDFAHKDIEERGYGMKAIGNGTEYVEGAKQPVPISFHTIEVVNENKSNAKGVKCKLFDPVEIVMWHKSKRMKPVARVCELPPKLLYIDDDGDVSGLYAEQYRLFKQRLSEKGLDLGKWGELPGYLIASLNSVKVFTVEQFASKMPDWLKSKSLPDEILKAHDAAISYMNRKDGNYGDVEVLASENASLQKEIAAMRAKEAEFLARLEALETKKEEVTPKNKRKKAGVIEE